MTKKKFKVGDLVVIKGFYFILGYSAAREGQLGIISEVFNYSEPDTDRFIDLLFDYVVLIGDEEMLMFEEEVEAISNFDPCSSCGCDPCDCNWGLDTP